jgi:hypothetical protein
MSPRFGSRDLDAEIVFDRFIGEGPDLDLLQELLGTLAPKWATKLRLWRGPRDQRPIEVGRPGALRMEVVAAAGERGGTYRGLVQRYGRPPLERLAGSAELRGDGPELFVIVSIDEIVVSSLGSKKRLGNDVALQVRRPRLEGQSSDHWLREAFEMLCSKLSPAWGWAGHPDEYWTKVMSDPPGAEAIGRDFGRFLPGVFWLNFFGGRYRDLLGGHRLRSSPATKVGIVDDGVVVQLASEPWAWNSPDYGSREQRVRDHLGRQLFFSKDEPDRVTVTPEW